MHALHFFCFGTSPSVLSQARNDAVELKLRVLDDKLLRAQISEEDKLKVVPRQPPTCPCPECPSQQEMQHTWVDM